MNKNFIFFLRHNNDIDHIIPIIWKLCTSKPLVNIEIIILSSESYLSDFRVKFLDQFKNCNKEFVGKYITGDYDLNCALTKQDLYAIAVKVLASKIQSNTVVALDWLMSTSGVYYEFGKIVSAISSDNQTPTVLLPHGDRPFSNWLELKNDIYWEKADIFKCSDSFNYVTSPNQHCANRYREMPPSRSLVLGSPRYNSEWLNIIHSFMPDSPNIPNDKLKILILPRYPSYSFNWEELCYTIEMLLQFQNIHIILQHHPRAEKNNKLRNAFPELFKSESKKLSILEAAHYSGNLVTNSDLLIDFGTSLSFEAVMSNIPILCPEYMHSNRSIISKELPKTTLLCRDELYKAINQFSKREKLKTYSKKERKSFIEKFIEPKTNVLEEYVNFLTNCKFKINKNKSSHEFKLNTKEFPNSEYDLIDKFWELDINAKSFETKYHKLLSNSKKQIEEINNISKLRIHDLNNQITNLKNSLNLSEAEKAGINKFKDIYDSERKELIKKNNIEHSIKNLIIILASWDHKISLFGAGKYTEQLLESIPRIFLNKINYIYDDAPTVSTIQKIPVLTPNKKFTETTLILSTDTLQELFKKRCEQIWGCHIQFIDLNSFEIKKEN